MKTGKRYRIEIEGFEGYHVAFLYKRFLWKWWFCIKMYDGAWKSVLHKAKQWMTTYNIPPENVEDLT